MSGLARVLLREGARVSGSDCQPGRMLTELEQHGARITTRQDAAALPAETELVVVSAAIPPAHAEFAEAARRGLRIMKYAEMLGALMSPRTGIAISGTHGKSTTTAWLTYVLRLAGLDPSFVIGAVVEQLGGGSGVGDGPCFVAEACEYDRSFLNLWPRYGAVLNIEEDHLDYYDGLEAITEAFVEFAGRVPASGLVVLNGDDERCRQLAERTAAPVETFGCGRVGDWRATEIAVQGGHYSFTLVRRGEKQRRCRLGIPGRHNVCNALAVAVLATHAGASLEAIEQGLAGFRGVRRRLEQRGSPGGVHVLDDYAHHPTEIQATLHAARERFQPRRLWCVFQPHQHSRTRFLLEDFARSFELADRIVVPDIYFVRDTQRDREAVCAADLIERIRVRGGDAVHIPAFDAIVDFLSREVAAGDLVLTMGAGTIWKVADELVRRLGSDLPR
ncbi:MAG: UDP-N-acetylmuramate--L-alanine ligase [Planctomycetes bacterium]|nr:UDP-N-acetylmuramate--L-alanine ligase [Planctomycetota bacterium]